MGPFGQSCLEWPRTNNMGAGGHPEHYEPKQRSVAASATQRTASKVLASQYWRPIFRGRNFGLKLKFYYANRPQGTRKSQLNWDRWPYKSILLAKFRIFKMTITKSREAILVYFRQTDRYEITKTSSEMLDPWEIHGYKSLSCNNFLNPILL